MDVSVIGIDLGKNSCSVAGMDAAGNVVFRRRVSRAGLVEIVRRHQGCIIAMEACCGAHYSGRRFRDLGVEGPWCTDQRDGRTGPNPPFGFTRCGRTPGGRARASGSGHGRQW